MRVDGEGPNPAVYGYCPKCGAKGVSRERRPDGNDECYKGHKYKSRDSLPGVEDPVVETVRQRLADRSAVGMKKYGVSMMRDDTSTIEWIDHAIEEALDFAVYLERLKIDLSAKKPVFDDGFRPGFSSGGEWKIG